MPPKNANLSHSQKTTGKNMAAAVVTRRRSGSSDLGGTIMVMEAATGAPTVFSLVNNPTKGNARQRKSRRAKTARKAPATRTVASGSIANGIPASHDIKTGGDSTTSMAATNDGPVRSPNAV